MRIKHTLLLEIARDTAMRRLLYGDDQQLAEKVIDNYQRHTQGHIAISASATEALSLGDVTSCKGIYLEVDQNCSVYLNGSADPIPLYTPPGASETSAKLFLEASITSISVENTSAGALTGLYVLWGDPTV